MARSRHRLSQQERHSQILALLRREGTVRIGTLADTFGVTTETVRRDLDALDESGALKRTYGGGTGRSLIDEPGIGVRSRAHAAERGMIGAAAAAMVATGDALMIDCGSTTTLFANALAARHLHTTVVTNSLSAAKVLGTNANCRVVLCPGDYVAREGGVYGADALDYIRRFAVDHAFIGAGGLTPDGVMDSDSRSCAIKRAMMKCANRAILLLDSSKYDVVQFQRVCPLADIDALVTDAAPPKRLSGRLKTAGVRVAIARE
jgi:DeoR/GlpR family transcriptional regulator of sugar metabolism